MREDVLYEKKQAHLSYYFQWSHDDDLEEKKEEEEKEKLRKLNKK